MSTNPYTSALGPALLTGVIEGNTFAIAEAHRRRDVLHSTSKWVRLCSEVLNESTTTTPKTSTEVKATPAPKKSRKGTGVGGSEHTQRRADARAWRIEQYHQGIKVSYRDACLHFGTLPAQELAQVGTEGLNKALKAYNKATLKAA